MKILREGELNGERYRLERRVIWQRTIASDLYVITDYAGDLYAFGSKYLADCHWRDMGIRALAQQEAA